MVRVGDPLTRRDVSLTRPGVEEFCWLVDVRPAGDGSFLVMAKIHDYEPCISRDTGIRVWPEDGRTEELWAISELSGRRIAYSPRAMIGVATGASLVTVVLDLRTGKVVRAIDNSMNARYEILSTTSLAGPRSGEPPLRALAFGAGGVGVSLLYVFRFRRRPVHPADVRTRGRQA